MKQNLTKQTFIVKLATVAAIGRIITSSLPSEAAMTVFDQGFETDATGWFLLSDQSMSPTRVASGTGGITSLDGGFHATLPGSSFTRWGTYSTPGSSLGYTTSLGIFLDASGTLPNGARFDYSSAASRTNGNHLRDFIFHVGFYNDSTGPLPDEDRFIISASFNSPGWDKNPNPAGGPSIAITETGWYTFQHTFEGNASNELVATLSVIDELGSTIGTFTLSQPDSMDVFGGNRYGWILNSTIPDLAIDSSFMSVAPEPARALFLLTGLVLCFAQRRRRS